MHEEFTAGYKNIKNTNVQNNILEFQLSQLFQRSGGMTKLQLTQLNQKIEEDANNLKNLRKAAFNVSWQYSLCFAASAVYTVGHYINTTKTTFLFKFWFLTIFFQIRSFLLVCFCFCFCFYVWKFHTLYFICLKVWKFYF